MGLLRDRGEEPQRGFQMREKMVSIGDDYWIEDEAGHVEVDGAPDMKVHGNIVDHEYEIERDRDKVAEISKKWFRVRDSYGVEGFDETDTVLLLAVTVAVDSFAHDVQ